MAMLHGKKVSLFTLNSNRELANEIADYLGIPLAECSVNHFADGEVNLDIKDTVRGHDCFIIQSTSGPVNEHYMELLIMIDALKRASAHTINVVMPYYGYCRQDRKAQSRQPISSKLVADLLTVAGATRVLALDLHAAQIQGFFNIPIDNFAAAPVMIRYLKEKNLGDVVIVSPDHGGAARARKFASSLADDTKLAIIDKRRPRPNVAEALSIIGDVEGKNCVLVDDIIDTAGTACAGIEALRKAGAKDIYMCASHAILSDPAIERISKSCLKELIVTNSIALPEEKKIEKITQLSVAKIFGQGILNILDDLPLSDLFTYNPDKEF